MNGPMPRISRERRPAVPVPAVEDRPLLGILLMLGFCVLAPTGDALAKHLGATVALAPILAVRFGIQAVILAPLIALTGRSFRLTPRLLWLTALRTLLHVAAIGAFFAALRFLPLADATAIAFVMPFLMLLLGRFVLGEEVGARRLVACAVGFAGTLMVIQPSFAAVGAPALLPLAVAVFFALFMLVTRRIARDADPIALQAASGAMATLVLLPLALADGRGWPPAAGAWGLLLLLGAVGTVAHLFMTWSLRFAPAATLAPMQYLEIPFATLAGWLAFGDLPNGLAAAGIAVTIAAGLYVIHRERLAGSLPAPGPPSIAAPASRLTDRPMPKINGNEIRPGYILEHDGGLWAAVKVAHVKPGKGGAFAQVELKNIRDGRKLNERFRSADKVERVRLEQKDQQFLYEQNGMLVFMDSETFEQIEIPADLLGDRRPFLQDGTTVQVEYYDTEPLNVHLPDKVTCIVAETEPAVKGQTAANSFKPAILDNGVRIMIPPFVGEGEPVVVSTETMEYVERA
jgi:translation elongation factor P